MPSSLVDQFLKKTSPATAMAMVGIVPDYNSHGHVTTDCPFCKSQMYVTSGDFLCSNRGCSFRVGNPVDFVAGVLGSYRKAVVDVYQAEGHKKNPPNEDFVVEAFENNRRLTKTILHSSLGYSRKRSSDILVAEGWLRKNNLDIESIRGHAFIWTEEDIVALNVILEQMKEEPIVATPGGFYLVIPYFSSYSTVGALVLVRKGNKDARIIRFSHEKFLWAGLLGLRQPPSEVKVTQNFALMLKMTQGGRLAVDSNTPCLGLLFNQKSVDTGIIPGKPVYVHHKDLDTTMGAPSCLASEYKDLEVISYFDPYTEENKKSWSSYIIGHLCDRINGSSIGDQTLHYLDSCRLGNHQKEQLVSELIFQGEASNAKRLLSHFGSEVIVDADRLKIRSSSGGYFSQDQKTGSRTDITNFTLSVRRNVVFADRREVITECDIQFGSSSSKLFIPAQHLDNPVKIEEAARLSWISIASQDNTLPIVKDKGLFRKYLAGYLKEETSRAQTVTGISQIGWSYDRKKYQGPGWSYDEDGRKDSECVLHGELEFLSCFTTKNVAKVFSDKCPQDLKDGVAMIIANFTRATLGMKCLPVMYDSSPEARGLLNGLFLGLGQERAFNGLLRNGAPDGCKDIPFLVTGSNFGFANLSLPVFCSSTEGTVTVDKDSGEKMAPGLVAHLVEALIDSYFTDGLKWFKPVHSTDNTVALMLEGSWIIKRLTGKEWRVSCSRKKIDEMLDQIPLENIGDVFELDISTQSVVIRTDKVPDGDTLIQELAVDYEITETGTWGAKVGMVDISRLLRNYYNTSSVSYGRFTQAG